MANAIILKFCEITMAFSFYTELNRNGILYFHCSCAYYKQLQTDVICNIRVGYKYLMNVFIFEKAVTKSCDMLRIFFVLED